jgi:sugar O-acyltransferase (sialic acid O-acetyltransferase NeuD family)
MVPQRIVIIGASGFAREVRWLLEEINRSRDTFRFLGYVVSDLARLGEHDSHGDILGDYEWLERHCDEVDAIAIGIGTPAARLTVSSDLLRTFPTLECPALVHPTVRLDNHSSRIGQGVLLCAGTIGTVNIHLEDFSLVNLACTLGHECSIGRGTVLNPTVNISGGVRLDPGVLVGTGAQVLQYLTVGTGATVGAGSVVTKNVEPGVTVIGIPAKPLQRH